MGSSSSASASDFVVLLSIVLLVASGALGGGIFLYKQYVESNNAKMLESLKRAQAQLEPALIQKFTRLDDRMQIAGNLLDQHEAYSRLFSVFEQTTIKTVTFKSLSISAEDPQMVVFAMEGLADSINSIALEADLFSKTGAMKSPIFSDVNRSSGGVVFKVVGELNQTDLSYAQTAAVDTGLSVQPAASATSPSDANAATTEASTPFGTAPAKP